MIKEEEASVGSQDSLSSGHGSLQNLATKESQTPEIRTCCDCQKSFKACLCKSCAKCGALFQRYWGTPIVKGRSHCRICCAAVCITCHVIVYGTFKICTRCHIKQKEDELSTQMALSAICSAKTCNELGVENLNFAATNVNSQEKKNEILCSAAKKGDHHVVSTILSAGADVNYKDSDGDNALFHASSGAHLPCMALLVEKGANCCSANKFGWTPLHALASKGTGDNIVECADLLIQMGADVFAMTEDDETAGDVAEHNGHESELVDLLRAAEIEEAIRNLYNRMSGEEMEKDRQMLKCLKTVLKVVTETSQQYQKTAEVALNEKTSPKLADTRKTMSLNRVFSRNRPANQVCRLCGQNSVTKNRQIDSDVEPVMPTVTDRKEPAEDIQTLELLAKCTKEKDELEQRCKRLMNSVSAAASTTEQKEVELGCLRHELKMFHEERDLAIQRCEATCANKVTKIRQEAELAVHEACEQRNESDRDIAELLKLRTNYKLTWVPDTMVHRCMNQKCRSPFSQTKRRHHCRCCGRVFCSKCTSHMSPIESFGYSEPVRVCNMCFALLDETFEEVNEVDCVEVQE